MNCSAPCYPTGRPAPAVVPIPTVRQHAGVAAGERLEVVDGRGTVLRVSAHSEEHAVVVSLWRHGRCIGTFRASPGQIEEIVDALRAVAAVLPSSAMGSNVGVGGSANGSAPAKRSAPARTRPDGQQGDPTIAVQLGATAERGPATADAPTASTAATDTTAAYRPATADAPRPDQPEEQRDDLPPSPDVTWTLPAIDDVP